LIDKFISPTTPKMVNLYVYNCVILLYLPIALIGTGARYLPVLQVHLVTSFCPSGGPKRLTSYLNHQISLCSKQL